MLKKQPMQLAIFEHSQPCSYTMVMFTVTDLNTPIAVKSYSDITGLINDIYIIIRTKSFEQIGGLDQTLLDCYNQCHDEFELEACFGPMIMTITENQIDFDCNITISGAFCALIMQICESKIGPYVVGAALKLT